MDKPSPLRIGDKVRMTAHGISQLARQRNSVTTGELFSIRPGYVRVRKTGQKTVTTYHESFWEKDLEGGQDGR